ncbi:MAG: hypothetical protein ABW007_13460 [Chitinophagaceae bacterium]
MPSFNIGGVHDDLENRDKNIIDKAENVQITADDPNSNEQDLYADILEFQEVFSKKELGKRIMLSAVKTGFTVDDAILQEVKS